MTEKINYNRKYQTKFWQFEHGVAQTAGKSLPILKFSLNQSCSPETIDLNYQFISAATWISAYVLAKKTNVGRGFAVRMSDPHAHANVQETTMFWK